MAQRTVDVSSPILGRNEEIAAALRGRFSAHGVFAVNMMSSPGSGKTSTILATDALLRGRYRSAVIEGDLSSNVDALAMKEAGLPAVQVNTGGLCHLEGHMIERACDVLDLDAVDVLFIENVGNLVCPVDFDLGEDLRVMILSVPEGDDKPLKYPGIFQSADVVMVNKVDVASAFDFDQARFSAELDDVSPSAARFSVSAKTRDGMDGWAEWLVGEIEEKRAQAL